MIPPPKNARVHRKAPPPCLVQRNEAVEEIRRFREEGRVRWKQTSGYHKRSLVETLMFRFKTIMGSELRSKIWENQVTEALIKLQAFNKMTELGMPESYKIAG